MYKTIIVLTISIMLATSSMASTFIPDSVAQKREITADSIITNNNSIAEVCDTIDFELPKYMMEEIDSMLNCWQARNLLKSLECDTEQYIETKITDTLYAERLRSMPTIVNMSYNRTVKSCIEAYTTKNRSLVAYMLGISEFYMPIIEEEINKAGIPNELKYLPIIESALNPKAVSRANAKGLWQFMFSTAKIYGLKSNNYIDERFDPIKSTRAAVRFLADLYKLFGKWELAIAAYNCGPGNVK
jgi:membrane-bound lytic murein transglycosylase D